MSPRYLLLAAADLRMCPRRVQGKQPSLVSVQSFSLDPGQTFPTEGRFQSHAPDKTKKGLPCKKIAEKYKGKGDIKMVANGSLTQGDKKQGPP